MMDGCNFTTPIIFRVCFVLKLLLAPTLKNEKKKKISKFDQSTKKKKKKTGWGGKLK